MTGDWGGNMDYIPKSFSGSSRPRRSSLPGMTAENPVRNTAKKYTAGEIGRVRAVEGFLPVADALVPREKNVKVTLSRRSDDFFKRAAKA